MSGGAFASYYPGTDDIAFRTAATDILPHLEVAHDALAIPSSSQTVPMIALLKLATLRMTSADRWDLTYFGHVVVKNGTRVARSVMREGVKLEDPKYFLDRQDVWATLNSMEEFSIATLGLAAAVEELLQPSILTSSEVMEMFKTTAVQHAKYGSPVTVTSLVVLFRNQITRYFTALRQYLTGSAKLPPSKTERKNRNLSEKSGHLRDIRPTEGREKDEKWRR